MTAQLSTTTPWQLMAACAHATAADRTKEVGCFEPLIGMLADPEHNLRANNMGDLHLGDVVDTLRLLRLDLGVADDLIYEQIPAGVRNNMIGGNFRNRLATLIGEMQQ